MVKDMFFPARNLTESRTTNKQEEDNAMYTVRVMALYNDLQSHNKHIFHSHMSYTKLDDTHGKNSHLTAMLPKFIPNPVV